MAIYMSKEEFIPFGKGLYWDVTDNIVDMRHLIRKGCTIVGVYVLRDIHPKWSNYCNTMVRYARWEHAAQHHAGAEIRSILNDTLLVWSIIHPVGDLYVVYA